ncbi:esterase/lipase family protein [Spirillospora sp. NPDC048911]|uniref:esterase/lipase family protein n=1 Tax=Spirillospora sp. NPDC048911 TaxID=3364527 RepID=UPI00371038A6
MRRRLRPARLMPGLVLTVVLAPGTPAHAQITPAQSAPAETTPTQSASAQSTSAHAASAQTAFAAYGAPAQVAQAAPPAPIKRPVYLVHGVQWDGGTDCETSWQNAKGALRRQNFRGPLITWGYYRDDRRCSVTYQGDVDTGIMELGRRLAWEIYTRHSRHGRPVGLLGHSMGGLIAAAALVGVHKYGGRTRTWPPYLRVTDVVTLSTPFQGVTCAAARLQCHDLRAGSPFLRWLASYQNPQGRGGTDWTLIGAYDDTQVVPRSALGTAARHKIVYLRGQRVTHTNVRYFAKGARWKFRYSHQWGKQVHQTAKGAAPLRAAALALRGRAQ